MATETIERDIQSERKKAVSSVQNTVGNFPTKVNGFPVLRHEKQSLAGRIPV